MNNKASSGPCILVVNGEKDWAEFFPEWQVERVHIQTSEWQWHGDRVLVSEAGRTHSPLGVLWRVGAIAPSAQQEMALRLLQLAGIPMVNRAVTLLQGYDRLSMLHQLQRSGLPVVPFSVVGSAAQIAQVAPSFPFVLKAGNLHGGYGKALVRDMAQLQDAMDLLQFQHSYITVEPYIRYQRDLRYLAVGGQVWAIQRHGQFWKVNAGRAEVQQVEPEAEWVEHLQALQRQLHADVLALDILEESDGMKWVVEYNDVPGLSGFPVAARLAVAQCLKDHIAQAHA